MLGEEGSQRACTGATWAYPSHRARVTRLLTFQLDRELISHNVRVSDLEERVNEMFLKSRDMLGVMEELRLEKVPWK